MLLSLKLGKPLFLEGEAGVGKTEIANVLATTLGRRLIRLQCYEGLDVGSAVYEWNYARQMIEIRIAEAGGGGSREALAEDVFSRKFLIERPLLQALNPGQAGAEPPVLLIDELDRADEPFEAFLLEVLADYQITIPEIGTIAAERPPIVVITSNRTREIHDALKRRCFYYWVDYPNAERELQILTLKAPAASERLTRRGGRVRGNVCARWTCSSCPASLKPSTGARLWWRWMRSVSNRRSSTIRWARCSSIRTTSPGCRAARRRGFWKKSAPSSKMFRWRAERARTDLLSVMASNQISPDGAPAQRGQLLANLIHFARALRACGIPIGSGRVLAAVEAVQAVGLANRQDLYWTLHAVFVNRFSQRGLFDQAFHVFWRNPRLLERMMALMLPPTDAPAGPDTQTFSRRLGDALAAGQPRDQRAPVEPPEIEPDAALTWPGREVLREKDFEQMSQSEIDAARAAIARLNLASRSSSHPSLPSPLARQSHRHARHDAGLAAERAVEHCVGSRTPAHASPGVGGALRHLGLDESLLTDAAAFRPHPDQGS